MFKSVCNLSFMSKILEKVVLVQLQVFLRSNQIYEMFQSGFRKLHSTETALLQVYNDILMSTDAGNAVALILLDLSSAFDMVDHNLLLSRLKNCVGLRGTVLNWFQSFLTNRKFSVCTGQYTSSSAPLTCGVPQGSILAPTLFMIYMLPMGSIFKKYDISFHLYADDTQLYLSFKPGDKNALAKLFVCIEELKSWLMSNSLTLNEVKTEVILFGPSDAFSFNSYNLDIGNLAQWITPCVRNLGVLFDFSLKFDKQINSVVRSCFFHLRRLAKVKTLLSTQTFEKVIHAFVTSRLDYCNSLYYGINQSSMERLQMVQNAAARRLTGTRKFQHITPILTTLQWLPVKLRVEYKILTLVFKALNNLGPIYLTELLQTHKSVRPLRSRFLGTLSMPRSRLKHRGDRAFVIVGPTLWNNLPVAIRTTTSLSIFKVMLKSHLLDRFAANQWRVFVSIYWDSII